MLLLEIAVPVYRRDRWARLEKDGKIQVSSEVDTLLEGYPSLKKELYDLLARVDAETRLAETAENLDLEIERKTHQLNRLVKDIELATEHYNNLKILLQNLGVDPNKKQLTFDTHLLLSIGPVSDVVASSDVFGDEF